MGKRRTFDGETVVYSLVGANSPYFTNYVFWEVYHYLDIMGAARKMSERFTCSFREFSGRVPKTDIIEN